MILTTSLARASSRLAFVLACSLVAGSASAQIVTGSDGSDGAFVFVQDVGPGSLANTMTVDLALAASGLDGMGQPITWQTPSPVAGRGVYDSSAWAVVFKYVSVVVPAGNTVRFTNHASRAPVVWLVQDGVTVTGAVSLDARSDPSVLSLPEPGPGGFRGSHATSDTVGSAISGFGPGGGLGNGQYITENCNYSGPATAGYAPAYGGAGCFPLIGGSGGASSNGGYQDVTSAAGGGALLLAAGMRITIEDLGSLTADSSYYWSGSPATGGSIRLVAHEVEVGPNAVVRAGGVFGASGRIRYEANQFLSTITPTDTTSFGAPSLLLPSASTAVLRVSSMTLGSSAAAVPVDPRASSSPLDADVVLSGSGTATIHLEARNVAPGATCQVRVIEFNGQGQWFMSTPLVGSTSLSTATATVPLVPGLFTVQAKVTL